MWQYKCVPVLCIWRRVKVNDIVTGLWTVQPRNLNLIPDKYKSFCHFHIAHTCSKAYLFSNGMVTCCSFLVGRAVGAWNWPLTSTERRNEEECPELSLVPAYGSMGWRLMKRITEIQKRYNWVGLMNLIMSSWCYLPRIACRPYEPICYLFL